MSFELGGASWRLSRSQTTSLSVSLGVTLCLGAIGTLLFAGRPVGASAEVQVLDTRLEALQDTVDRTSGASDYPRGTVCHGAAAAAAHDLEGRLKLAAATDKLGAVAVSVSPEPATDGLRPIGASFDANGSYASVVGLLRQLKDARPGLFLDRVDLLSKGAFVHLHFGGRAYCA